MPKKLFLIALTLLPLSAYAIDCVEYFKQQGTTTLHPFVRELTPDELTQFNREIGLRKISPKVVSEKGILTKNGPYTVESFPSLEKSTFPVFGIDGPRDYIRPDFKEVTGFRSASPLKAASDANVASTEGGGFLKTQSRAIAYGSKANAQTVIYLKTNERIATLANLGPEARLVVTTRFDQNIGFATKSASLNESYKIEVYFIQPTGHSFLGFHVPATKSTHPSVAITQFGESDVLLNVDGHSFQLTLETEPQISKQTKVRLFPFH